MRIELKCGCGASAVFDDSKDLIAHRAIVGPHAGATFVELDDNGDRWLAEKRAREWLRQHPHGQHHTTPSDGAREIDHAAVGFIPYSPLAEVRALLHTKNGRHTVTVDFRALDEACGGDEDSEFWSVADFNRGLHDAANATGRPIDGFSSEYYRRGHAQGAAIRAIEIDRLTRALQKLGGVAER